MKTEFGLLTLLGLYPGLGFVHDADEDSEQFIGFLPEWSQRFLFDDLGFAQQFKPIKGFFDFLKPAFDFTDEISIGLGTLRFTIMSATEVPDLRICLPSTCASVVLGSVAYNRMIANAKFFVLVIRSLAILS
jgi:hypothetical protein